MASPPDRSRPARCPLLNLSTLEDACMTFPAKSTIHRVPLRLIGLFAVALQLLTCEGICRDVPTATDDGQVFAKSIEPFLQKYCVRCHSADNMKSGIRVDGLTANPEDRQLFLLKDILKQLDDGAMPPVDEAQPTDELRMQVSTWITQTLHRARSRPTPRNGSIRRLTVSQYRNTLRELLSLEEDLTEILPPDGLSKDGFANNSQSMVLSPLQIESYFDIAEKALDLSLVDPIIPPVIQNFRMDLGTAINPTPCPDSLILGANNHLLNNADLLVTELKPERPFPYQPFAMRTAYEFIEGYVGNDTIRAWRKFDSIYHSVFACMRGTPGYPKGEAFQVVPSGLLLRPAIPSPEIFGQSNTYGPMANFKISLRELPDQGNFKITVKAARYDDLLLLDASDRVQETAPPAISVALDLTANPPAPLAVPADGIYQVDVWYTPGKSPGMLSLTLGERQVAAQLRDSNKPMTEDASAAFLVTRLNAGPLPVIARCGDNGRLRRLILTRIADDSDVAIRFQAFEKRTPSLGVYLGLRRDCGSTLTMVGAPRKVVGGELQDYVFTGAIRDFPNPDVEKDNVNYLAGIREIGVRSEYTDGRDMPRLRIRSVEFEGPYYTSWPPAAHRQILLDSPHRDDPAVYAREVIARFATRAYRRPATAEEQDAVFGVWQKSYAATKDFRQSVKDALLVVLTSPQFLFLIENSSSPAAEDLNDDELASKLSYFLWNGPPDQRLLDLAQQKQLHAALDSEIDRMIHDPRFARFVSEFASQWLSLDKFDVVAIDSRRYPRLTRDARTQLRQEPVQFLQYLIEQNLSLRHLVQSDFVMGNEVVASYYNMGDRTESGFQFMPIPHRNSNLGGLLTQAGILAGHSDGRESNPIKRGAWVARKIVAEPPDDPPPNVPQLKDEDGTKLTLREKLERHRNQQGCAKCHGGIDPWGIPFESFDAGGLLKTAEVDTSSTLPDGSQVKNLNELKAYLAGDRIDQVAFSVIKHLACYAVGRGPTYNEIAFLQEHGLKLKSADYQMQDVIQFVIKSDLFLKK